MERAARKIGTSYVISRKPSPAVLTEDAWLLELARRQLQEALQEAHGCRIEIIVKGISTVRYQPQRLWAWGKAAMELTESFVP